MLTQDVLNPGFYTQQLCVLFSALKLNSVLFRMLISVMIGKTGPKVFALCPVSPYFIILCIPRRWVHLEDLIILRKPSCLLTALKNYLNQSILATFCIPGKFP